MEAAECVRELRAFVRGGRPGMHVLNRVFPQILRHYGIDDARKARVLASAGLIYNGIEGRLQRVQAPPGGSWGSSMTTGAKKTMPPAV
jgi:hypothetical protein